MKFFKIGVIGALLVLTVVVLYHFQSKENQSFFKGDDTRIQYIGRFDFGDKRGPKVWAPGAYVTFDVVGSNAQITIADEQKFGKMHNYLEVVVDGHPKRIKLRSKINQITLFSEKDSKRHHVLICKNTESAIGYIQILGIRCKKLLRIKKHKKQIFEFIGDSITCGNGADSTQLAFGKGAWYDYHNAYLSYGARLARAFHADWMLSSVSGIGMNHSCCGLKHRMPEVYESIDFHLNSPKWKFHVQPQFVFITLGQNDGSKFMLNYEKSYLAFLKRLRRWYPKSWFICCTSPMADQTLKEKMKSSIRKIISTRQACGDQRIRSFSYQGKYTAGYDKHPTVAQHEMMMRELKRFLMEQNNVTHLNEIVF